MVAPIHGPCGKTASRPGRQTRGSQVLKSLLSGGFLAAFIGVFALLALSIAAPPPSSNEPPAMPLTDAPTVAEVAPEGEAEVEAATVLSDQTDVAATPEVSAPEVEVINDVLDTTPLEMPQTAAVEGGLTAPEEIAAPQIEPTEEDAIVVQLPARAPQAPLTEEEVVVSTQPAAPLPVIEEVAPDEPKLSESAEAIDPAATDNATGESTEALIEVPDAPVQDTVTAEDDSDQFPATPSDVGAPETAVVVQQPQTPPAEPEAEDAPVVTAGVATTSSGLPTGTSGVRVNRVIGSQPEPVTPSETTEETDPDAPALVKYAAAFENVDSKPTLAIILLDDPAQADGAALIGSLPFPVTVVIDSATADATARMAAYRAAGVEVALRSTFPQGALPSDVEVTLQSALSVLPDAVAFVDEGGTGLQSSRDISNQTIEAMAADGRGLVIMPKGLNSALRTAETAGVPAATIFRNLDGDGQDARVIKRFIDQAAFRARQDGGVILMGRIRTETLTALVDWQSANRAGQVVMAPLSAMLLAQES